MKPARLRFTLGARDRARREVRGRDLVPEHAEAESLRADAASSVENGGPRPNAEFLKHLGESATLAGHTRFPVRIEKMVIRSEFVVEGLSHAGIPNALAKLQAGLAEYQALSRDLEGRHERSIADTGQLQLWVDSPIEILICAVAIGINHGIAVPDERKEHGMTEPNRGTDHDVRDDRGELNGCGEEAPLQQLTDAGDEATRERFRASSAALGSRWRGIFTHPA